MLLGPRSRHRARRRRPVVDGPFCPWPLPVGDVHRLARLEALHFIDDGCSNSPDGWFWVVYAWACRLHDADYCTRANPPGWMTDAHRRLADESLRFRLSHALRAAAEMAGTLWVAVIPVAYWTALRQFGDGAYDTCGVRPVGATAGQMARGLCRHGLAMR